MTGSTRPSGDGVLRLEGNIRPDWQPGGKPGAKTKRKVDRWAEELLKNNAVMGNLSVRLNPDTAKYEFIDDDEGDFTLRLFAGHLDTGADSSPDSPRSLRPAAATPEP